MPGTSIHTNNVLVLIQPAIAGPAVSQENYWKPEQVLWPPAIGSGNGGRLLSVASGENWVGDMEAFREKNFAAIDRHGYFDARKTSLSGTQTALLVGPTGFISTNAQILALNDVYGKEKPYGVGDSWPKGRLMVAEARSWDEEKAFRTATSGRVLVVEYPPRVDRPWTRFWLDGNGWPRLPSSGKRPTPISDTSLDTLMAPEERDLAIPGLVRARDMVKLVTRPADFRWVRVEQKSWPGAGRFLDLGHQVYPWVQLGWILAAALILVWGAIDVIGERSSRVLPLVLRGLLLSPAVADVAGLVGRYLGMDEWPIWIFLSMLAIVSLSAGLGAALKRTLPRAHELAAPFLIGLATLCLVNPIWGLMSPILSLRVWYVSPVALASLFGYLVGFVSCIHGCGTLWNWVGRALCLSFFFGGLATRAWWTADLGATIAMPLLAWLIGEGRFRWPMLFAFAVWPTSLVALVVGGLIWAPNNLLINGRDLVGLNIFDHVEFLIAPSLLLAWPVAGLIALFGYKFFIHQMSMVWRMDPRRLALLQAAACSGALGLLNPIFLYCSLTLGGGGLAAMLFDAVQTM